MKDVFFVFTVLRIRGGKTSKNEWQLTKEIKPLINM